MEQALTHLANENPPSNSAIKPTIVKDVVLLAPGVWIGEDLRETIFTEEEIEAGFKNSDFKDMNLFLDHIDAGRSAVDSWVGKVKEVRLESGRLMGDLEVWHPLIGMFIKEADAKFAVSASMNGIERIDPMGGPSGYRINNFKSMSLVDEPGCKESWLPKALSKGLSKEDIKTVVSGYNIKDIKSLAEHSPYKTSVVNGHSHTWIKGSKVTSEVDGHTHSVDEETGKAVKGSSDHEHTLLTNESNTDKEESDHKKKSRLKSMKGGIKVMENKNSVKKVEEEKTKNLSSETEESEEKESEEKESEDSSSEGVKNLSNKIDKLADVVMSISETVKTLSADKEESKEEESSEETESNSSEESSESTEEKSDEESKEESEESSEEEEGESNNELEETKKELAALKDELNSPDRKTLAFSDSGNISGDVSSDSANAGMMSFLRETAGIPLY